MFITLPIKKIVQETEDVRSFYFDFKLELKPGQFVMLWMPGVDEKPFGISYKSEGSFAISVFKVGPFTEKLFTLKEGDYVGIKGPFGTNFGFSNEKSIALVAGGCGIVSLITFAEEILKNKPDVKIYFINGAKSKDKLLFMKRLESMDVELLSCTDDGSFGKKCFTPELLSELIKEKEIELVCACGPEIMMKKIFDICEKEKISCQLSLERMMKCGGGLCGSCTVDPTGWRVCKEGPVFDNNQIRQISEFGKYKRSESGRIVDL